MNTNILEDLFSKLYSAFEIMDDDSLGKSKRVENGFKPAYEAVQEIDNLVSYVKGKNSATRFSFVSILHMSKLPPLTDRELEQSASFSTFFDDAFKDVSPEEQEDILQKVLKGEITREGARPAENPGAMIVSDTPSDDEEIEDESSHKRLYDKFEKTFVRMDSTAENERTTAYRHASHYLKEIREADNNDLNFSAILKASSFEKRLEREMQGFDTYATPQDTFNATSGEKGLTVQNLPHLKPRTLSQLMKEANIPDISETDQSVEKLVQEALDELKNVPWEEIKTQYMEIGAIDALGVLFSELQATKNLDIKLESGEPITIDDCKDMFLPLSEKWIDAAQSIPIAKEDEENLDVYLQPLVDFERRQSLRYLAIYLSHPELEEDLIKMSDDLGTSLACEALRHELERHHINTLGRGMKRVDTDRPSSGPEELDM